MTAGPFAFDNSEPTLIKGSECKEWMKQFGGRKKKEKGE